MLSQGSHHQNHLVQELEAPGILGWSKGRKYVAGAERSHAAPESSPCLKRKTEDYFLKRLNETLTYEARQRDMPYVGFYKGIT